MEHFNIDLSMFRKIGLPIIALIGIVFCIYMVYVGSKKPPVAQILFPPATSPYEHFIAGEGLVEFAYKNIAIAVPLQELVSDIYVKVGDKVKKGDWLFKNCPKY